MPVEPMWSGDGVATVNDAVLLAAALVGCLVVGWLAVVAAALAVGRYGGSAGRRAARLLSAFTPLAMRTALLSAIGVGAVAAQLGGGGHIGDATSGDPFGDPFGNRLSNRLGASTIDESGHRLAAEDAPVARTALPSTMPLPHGWQWPDDQPDRGVPVDQAEGLWLIEPELQAAAVELDWPVAEPTAVVRAPLDSSADADLVIDVDWPVGGSDSDGAAADGAGTGTGTGAGTVTVQPGDTLWSIAAARLPAGDGEISNAKIDAAWRQWYAANRDVIGADPNLILPGQQLRPPG